MSTLDSVQRWIESMRARNMRKPYPASKMSPWDEFKYFQSPKETLFNFTTTTAPLPNVLADPQRVAIIFSLSSGAGACITIDGNAAVNKGIFLNATYTTHQVLQSEFGNLAQVAWFHRATTGPCVMTVIEVTLLHWPGA